MTDAPMLGPAQQADAFMAAVSFLIDRLEGGDKLVTDTGGLTKYGISKKAFPEVDIAALTRTDAIMLYRIHYWATVDAGKLPGPLALAVFDAAVNVGAVGAVRILQRVVGVPDDGVLGPQTLAAVQRYRSPVAASDLVALYIAARVRWYYDLAATKPHHVPSLRGWINRCAKVAVECGRLTGQA